MSGVYWNQSARANVEAEGSQELSNPITLKHTYSKHSNNDFVNKNENSQRQEAKTEQWADVNLATLDPELWTFEKFKDEFFLCLAKIKVDNGAGEYLSDRKYYTQAEEKIYKIPIYKPTLPFTIELTDLTPRLRSEFKEYCKLNKRKVIGKFLIDIAVRFFENINFEYTHLSVIRALKVELK